MNETQQILTMLQEGAITAQEAERLLNALQTGQTAREPIENVLPQPSAPLASPPTPALVKRFHGALEILFGLAVVLTAVSGCGVFALYRRADRHVTWGVAGLSLVFASLLLIALVLLWLWRARWLHVRIRDEDGKGLAISLPIPLLLLDWGLRIARHWVDSQTAEYLNMASAFVRAARQSQKGPAGETMSVQVDEGNEQVQVYIE